MYILGRGVLQLESNTYLTAVNASLNAWSKYAVKIMTVHNKAQYYQPTIDMYIVQHTSNK